MPIEIRELVIRAEVNTSPMHVETTLSNDELRNELKREIIDACMYQIKEAIRENNHR